MHQQSGWTATTPRLICAPTSTIPTIFMPDALSDTTLPIYPGLGQAPNMLACMPGGLVSIIMIKKVKTPWVAAFSSSACLQQKPNRQLIQLCYNSIITATVCKLCDDWCLAHSIKIWTRNVKIIYYKNRFSNSKNGFFLIITFPCLTIITGIHNFIQVKKCIWPVLLLWRMNTCMYGVKC